MAQPRILITSILHYQLLCRVNLMEYKIKFCGLLFFIFVNTFPSLAQKSTSKSTSPDAAEVAKKLANPIASLISLPFQNNLDVGIGVNHGSRNTLNIQPVIPVNLSPKLNLIARIVLPVISQQNVSAKDAKESGLADAIVSAFFSPAMPKNGLVWGAGPCFLVPTATNDLLASKKFGIGPTAVILKQANGWTVGALINQIWSVAGDKQRSNVNQMFFQPFAGYNWKSGAGLVINSEMTQNWEGDTFTFFLNPMINGISKIGKQIVQLQIGPRISIAAPEANRADFGLRASFILVFPK
jgi:hypothetical protein